MGDDPVARPITQFSFLLFFFVIKSAISLATALDPSSELLKITL